MLFVPNLVLLCARLMVDGRVPRTERALVAAAVAYALMPFDFMPDLFPFVGQIDDAYLLSLTILRLVSHTDPRVVREHWNGGGDLVAFAQSVATIASAFLPGRVRRVLEANVSVAEAPLDPKTSERDGIRPVLTALDETMTRLKQ